MLLKGMRNQFFERKTSRAERNARTAQAAARPPRRRRDSRAKTGRSRLQYGVVPTVTSTSNALMFSLREIAPRDFLIPRPILMGS